MNVRRGLFRLWIIFAVLFAVATTALSYTDVRNEFFWANPPKEIGWNSLLPVDCSSARGTAGADYSMSEGLCWFEAAKFRVLYPEYRDLGEKELSERIYAKAGRPLKEMQPWTLIAQRAGVAVGVPLLVLVFGSALLWAFAGFRRT